MLCVFQEEEFVQPPKDGSVSTLDHLPPALEHLLIKGLIIADDVIKMTWIVQVRAHRSLPVPQFA